MRWMLVLCACALSAATPPDPAGWQSLYREDFERGVLSGWTGSLEQFQVVKDGNNSVLAGENGSMTLKDGFWRDYRFKVRVKLVDQTQIWLGFRHSQCGGYEVWFTPGGVNLTRQLGCNNWTQLASRGAAYEVGRWYTLEVVGRGALIRVYVDGSLQLELTDANPVLGGGIMLWVADGGHVRFDDLEVAGPPDTSSLLWVRTGGPHGGVGYDIRMRPDNPDHMMVTDLSSGVSISTDGGKTWRPSNEGITSRGGVSGDAIPIFCLTIDPTRPDTVWAGTQNMRGIYKSTDGGKTWVQKDRGVVEGNGVTFRGFTVDPRNSNVVYAAGHVSSTVWAGEFRLGRMFDMVKGVVYKTTDGGENWRAVWRGDSLARYIWIDPRDSQVLYVSTGIFDAESANSDPVTGRPGGVGILKSTDGGATWRVLNQANGLNNLYVGSLFIHPANPDILLAGTGHAVYGQYQGVYLSTDGGTTWRLTMDRAYLSGPPSPDHGDQITAVEFAGSDPRIAYAASGLVFYRSEDGGVTWRVMAGSPEAPGFGPPGMRAGIPMDLQVDPRNPNRVFVNNYTGGNVLTEDGGRTWQYATSGYTGADLHDIAIDPSDSQRVYTIGRSGVYRSDGGGADWIGLNYPAGTQGPLAEWYGVAVDPHNPRKTLFADEMSGTLLLSHEAGLNWRVVFRQPDTNSTYGVGHGFKALTFAPSDAGVAYAGMSADRAGLQKFPGQTSFGVYKSTDGGETWLAANDSHTAQQNINVLVVDPRNANTVYAGTVHGGVLKTQDGGGTWAPMNFGLRVLDVRSIAIDPSNPNVLYAGAEKGGVYQSTNGGGNWAPMSAGMDPGATVRDIVIDPTNTQVVYASDLQLGVFRSEDGGKLWVQISRGLTTRAVKALSLSSDGSTLYAATEGGGVFRLDLKTRVESPLGTVSAASFTPAAPLAPESIAAMWGQGLADAIAGATVLPLPTELGGARVVVTDSDGMDREAPLFFASPGQINFLVPAGTVRGLAAVRVFRQGRVVARGTVEIEAAAPGLFTANASGGGVPAAVGVRASGSTQTQIPVFQCGSTAGSCATAPIDLGAETDQVFLLLFGTGIRGGANATVRIGDVDAEVSYAGAQGGLVGLDQVNVKLPRALAGRGEVDLVLTVDGTAANTVRVRIK